MDSFFFEVCLLSWSWPYYDCKLCSKNLKHVSSKSTALYLIFFLSSQKSIGFQQEVIMCEKKLISESTTLVSKKKQLFWINISIKKYTLFCLNYCQDMYTRGKSNVPNNMNGFNIWINELPWLSDNMGERGGEKGKAILALHSYHNLDVIIFICRSSKTENWKRFKQITEAVARKCSCKKAFQKTPR